MLDPHAANPDVSGQQYSVAYNLLGWVAKCEIDKYQAEAQDPPAIVPAGSTPPRCSTSTPRPTLHMARMMISIISGDKCPVEGNAVYFNLTGDRVTHSGTAFTQWYEATSCRLLGDGAPQLTADALTGTATAQSNSADPHQPVFRERPLRVRS